MDIDCDGNIDSTIDNNINARIIFDNKNVNNEGDCNDNLIANKLFLIIIIVIVVLVIQFDLQIEFS